jgi:hypothetical protein
MAGAIPIAPSPRELGLLRRLTFHDLRLVLADLDELGWAAARERLERLEKLPAYQQQTNHGETWR